MTNEHINQRIAEACGWKEVEPWLDGDRCFELNQSVCGYRIEDIPNYCTDLNAIHEAEKIIKNTDKWRGYKEELNCMPIDTIHATARQKAEAYLKALGKWNTQQDH